LGCWKRRKAEGGGIADDGVECWEGLAKCGGECCGWEGWGYDEERTEREAM